MFKTLKGILFLLNVVFIFGKEISLYLIFKDYSLLIDRLSIRLSSINILCVKMFQAIALNNNLIDDETNNKLLKFTDNAPWNFKDINLIRLIELASKYNLILRQGYEIPINAGMISLVFKAYDKTNSPIIIKMKRKNIQQQLDDAIDNLLFLIYLLSFISIFNKYQIVDVINKNIEIIRHQTNFLEEVENMDRIKHNCKNLKYVIIPSAVKEVTEEYPDCILMEYIEGIKINQIKEEDYEGFAKQVMKFGFVTTIVHGVTHGDLHGGNIIFIKDNSDVKYPYKIGVIDFGIIYELEPTYKELLFELLTQMFEIPSRETAIKLLQTGIIDTEILRQISKEDYENILNFTTEIIDETINNSKKANQMQIYKFISKIKDCLCNSCLSTIRIRPSDNFVKTQLVLAMTHGVTLTLCNNDYVTLADKVINELFHTNVLM